MQYRVRADIHYTDGTIDANINITGLIEIAQYSTWRFPVGYNVILPFSNALKTISKWDVWLIDAGSPVARRTPKITYKVVDSSFLDMQLIYESSTGAWETIMLTGRKDEGIEVSKDEFQKLIPVSYNNEDAQLISRLLKYSNKMEVGTGFKRKDEFLPLTDLLISGNILLYKNGKRIRVKIDPDSFSMVRSDDYLYALNLTLVRAYDQRNFSNIGG